MTEKQTNTEKQTGARVSLEVSAGEPRVRVNPRERALSFIDDLLGDVTGSLEEDRTYIANALIAYGLAVQAQHPAANYILEDALNRYSSKAGITLPEDLKYDAVDHERALHSIGSALREYRQSLEEPSVSENYGSRK